MIKANVGNERQKRAFFRYLKEAQGKSTETIKKYEQAVIIYEEFSKFQDFSKFSPERATRFKNWLKIREVSEKPLSNSTYVAYLRYLREFFSWLAQQRGFKQAITRDAIDYLNPSRKEKNMSQDRGYRVYPSKQHVLDLVNSIHGNTEIDMRDRALFAFTLLSGMRIDSIRTLPLECFDLDQRLVFADPRKGVRTKFGKSMVISLMIFNDTLMECIKLWKSYLDAKFKQSDPLFPRAKSFKEPDCLSYSESTDVEPSFFESISSLHKIFKDRSDQIHLKYYSPHSYRHLAVSLALKYCKTGKEIKAISQNFGHEYVATTFMNYGNMQQTELSEALGKIDFNDG